MPLDAEPGSSEPSEPVVAPLPDPEVVAGLEASGDAGAPVERSPDVLGTPVGCGGEGWLDAESVVSPLVDESVALPPSVPLVEPLFVLGELDGALLGWSPFGVPAFVGVVVLGGCSVVEGTRWGDVPCEPGCRAEEPLVAMLLGSEVAGASVGVVVGEFVEAASSD